MKSNQSFVRLSLVVMLMLASIFSFAQNVPNGSFENWGNRTTETLKDWYIVGSAEKTNDASVGSTAIKLTNNLADQKFGFITSGPFLNDRILGVAYDEQPLSMRFDAKYDLAIGDVGQVIAIFTNKGNTLAYASFEIAGSSSDTFVTFSVPITWQVSTLPDSVAYVISTRDLDEEEVYGDGYLIVDDFHFSTISTRNKVVPNGSFENWDQQKTSHLTGWYTTDDYILELTGSAINPPSVLKSDAGRFGTNAIELHNRNLNGENAGGIMLTGNSLNDLEKPAFAVNEQWKYLEGYYQFSPENGDSALFVAFMYKQGIPIGTATLTIGKAASTYTYFAAPIRYGVNIQPDSASVAIACADPDDAKGLKTWLRVDDIQFSMTPSSSVFDPQVNKLQIYPNPFTHTVTLNGLRQAEGAKYTVTNAIGTAIEEGDVSIPMQIDLQHVQPGVYILNLSGRYINTSKIIIKE